MGMAGASGRPEYGDRMPRRHRTWPAEDAVAMSSGMSRRQFVSRTAVASAAALMGGDALAQARQDSPALKPTPSAGRGGLLHPQQNQLRNLLDASGLWQFQLDPKEEGESRRWFDALPAPRMISVPCS